MPTLMHELASTSPPNPLQPLRCLHSRTALKICLCGSAPISSFTHPHASAPVPLNMLTLLLRPQDILQTPPPHLCAPTLSSPPLTILMLIYASRYPSNACTSSMHRRLAFSTAYHLHASILDP
ncbi:hypothetical protein O181_050925 [Austropuccinia psidii MF-1]|uniref:Uncharacterized protein n=1 Tax=Austropuccinia psidii MF-1 TaxID=1389203 RepID=A0A9Q3HRB8_9BASI|nr:hypothetical protein [Austropuccinia psidii MF-1]